MTARKCPAGDRERHSAPDARTSTSPSGRLLQIARLDDRGDLGSRTVHGASPPVRCRGIRHTDNHPVAIREPFDQLGPLPVREADADQHRNRIAVLPSCRRGRRAQPAVRLGGRRGPQRRRCAPERIRRDAAASVPGERHPPASSATPRSGTRSTSSFRAVVMITEAVIPWRQLPVRVRCVDHRGIGNHVLESWSAPADVPDGSVERFARVRIDGEPRFQPRVHLADVRLVDVGEDSASREVVRIRNSVGAWRAAATVWPTSTLRDTTMPSIGLAILVNARFVAAISRSAFACSTDAFAADNAAAFWFAAATAVSRSACEIRPCWPELLLARGDAK